MTQTEAERRAEERKKRLEKYFHEAPDPRNKIVARALMVIGGAGLAASALLFATIGAGLAGVVLWCAATTALTGCVNDARYRKEHAAAVPRPTDREMDRMLAEALVDSSAKAMKQLGFTVDDLALTSESWDPIAHLERGNPILQPSERRPLLVFGPYETAKVAVGRDGVWRFSEYRIMVICPTHYNFGLYMCATDLLSGTLSREETHEYHYDDVVAISTVTVADEEPRPLGIRDEGELRFARTLVRELRIMSSSGDSRSIYVAVPGHSESGRATTQLSSGIDDVISAVRRVLREKKGMREASFP
jgi:hypothetical protein